MQTQPLSSGARLTHFPLPEKAEKGVLVLPGGGYGHLATGHEGQDIASWLNARGYAAWVLEYRVASSVGEADLPLLSKPLDDALEAICEIRALDQTEKLGIWGFSAGGHLAATVATEVGSDVDFAVLAYAVISLEAPFTHLGSRRNLIGESPEDSLATALSAHRRVSATTPPTFLFHTGDDGSVPVENSLLFYAALRESGVPAELHIYETGAHGVGLALANPDLSAWSAQLEQWLSRR